MRFFIERILDYIRFVYFFPFCPEGCSPPSRAILEICMVVWIKRCLLTRLALAYRQYVIDKDLFGSGNDTSEVYNQNKEWKVKTRGSFFIGMTYPTFISS